MACSSFLPSFPPSCQLILFFFVGNFNQPVDNLPPSITHLRLSNKFNQPLKSLPPSLKSLTFGKLFNQDVLPLSLLPSLTSLHFGRSFNQPLPSLPPSLTSLSFKQNFNQDISNIPDTITHLTLGMFVSPGWVRAVGKCIGWAK